MRRRIHFDSLAAWHNAIKPAASKRFENPGFAGATLAQARARRFAWPEGLAQLAQLPELAAPMAAAVTVKTWSEDDGDEMSVDRYRDGLPFLSRRIKLAGQRNRGPRAVVINATEGCDKAADALLWKAYAAARLVDELESTGTRAEIILAFHARRSWENGDDLALTVTLKSAADPLNLAAVLAAVAPWTLRVHCLDYIDTLGRAAFGYGKAQSIAHDMLPAGALVIDSGDCLSKSAAADYITRAGTEGGPQ